MQGAFPYLCFGRIHIRRIKDLYGDQNTTEDVFFSDRDEAIIFVKDIVGTMGLCVSLSNVAKWAKQDGLSRDQVCEQYLLIP